MVCSVIGFGSPGQAIIATHGGKTNDRSFSCSTIELRPPRQSQGKPQKAHRSLSLPQRFTAGFPTTTMCV